MVGAEEITINGRQIGQLKKAHVEKIMLKMFKILKYGIMIKNYEKVLAENIF